MLVSAVLEPVHGMLTNDVGAVELRTGPTSHHMSTPCPEMAPSSDETAKKYRCLLELPSGPESNHVGPIDPTCSASQVDGGAAEWFLHSH